MRDKDGVTLRPEGDPEDVVVQVQVIPTLASDVRLLAIAFLGSAFGTVAGGLLLRFFGT